MNSNSQETVLNVTKFLGCAFNLMSTKRAANTWASPYRPQSRPANICIYVGIVTVHLHSTSCYLNFTSCPCLHCISCPYLHSVSCPYLHSVSYLNSISCLYLHCIPCPANICVYVGIVTVHLHSTSCYLNFTSCPCLHCSLSLSALYILSIWTPYPVFTYAVCPVLIGTVYHILICTLYPVYLNSISSLYLTYIYI